MRKYLLPTLAATAWIALIADLVATTPIMTFYDAITWYIWAFC